MPFILSSLFIFCQSSLVVSILSPTDGSKIKGATLFVAISLNDVPDTICDPPFTLSVTLDASNKITPAVLPSTPPKTWSTSLSTGGLKSGNHRLEAVLKHVQGNSSCSAASHVQFSFVGSALAFADGDPAIRDLGIVPKNGPSSVQRTFKIVVGCSACSLLETVQVYYQIDEDGFVEVDWFIVMGTKTISIPASAFYLSEGSHTIEFEAASGSGGVSGRIKAIYEGKG
jgi:hypothetical protein